MSCVNPVKILWTMTRGCEFAEDIEFNELTVDGDDFDLTGRVVIVTIGDTEYRSDTDPELDVPTPSEGVAEFRLGDADTAAFALQRYSLTIEVENDTGFTTRYREGVVQVNP